MLQMYWTQTLPTYFLFHLKKPPSLKVVMVKWFYQKKRNICYDKICPNGKNYLIQSINVNIT